MDVFVLLEKKKKKKKVVFPPKCPTVVNYIYGSKLYFFYFSPQCNFSHIWNHVLCFDSILFYKEMYN